MVATVGDCCLDGVHSVFIPEFVVGHDVSHELVKQNHFFLLGEVLHCPFGHLLQRGFALERNLTLSDESLDILIGIDEEVDVVHKAQLEPLQMKVQNWHTGVVEVLEHQLLQVALNNLAVLVPAQGLLEQSRELRLDLFIVKLPDENVTTVALACHPNGLRATAEVLADFLVGQDARRLVEACASEFPFQEFLLKLVLRVYELQQLHKLLALLSDHIVSDIRPNLAIRVDLVFSEELLLLELVQVDVSLLLWD